MRRRGPLGTCDRCGFTCKHDELMTEFVAGRENGLRVCPRCWDDDHPQNFLHLIRADDPRPLTHARPESYTDGLFGWQPIGNPEQYLKASLGTLRVRIGS